MVEHILRFHQQVRQLVPSGVWNLIILAALGLLLAGGTALVYFTGGTAYAYPYVMFIPVSAAAAVYGIWGGVLSALVAGLLVGPLMPLNVSEGTLQSTSNWLIRIGLYIGLGFIFGGLFSLLSHSFHRTERLLRRDARTGLPNSAALDEDVQASVARLTSWHIGLTRPVRAVQVTFVRLTDLSDILETLGPDAGDRALFITAGKISRSLRSEHRLYRFSVSEIVILEEKATPGSPERTLGRISKATQEILEVSGAPMKLSAVMGTAHIQETDPEQDALHLVRNARLAMTAALEKQTPFQIYDQSLETRRLNLVRVITGVRTGLMEGEFDLHFQPKICLRTGAVKGCEALIRWRRSTGELISPAEFMPKVESTSLIDPVTRFVLQRACQFLQTYPDQHVSINFAARNLFDEELVNSIPAMLKQYGIAPEQLEIELTESTLIRNPKRAREIIQGIRDIGLDVSIDDFGTGYSSFEYLSDLPVTGLKIDRAFVQKLDEDGPGQSIMETMLNLGRALNLVTTLEGVETESEYTRLKAMGGDLAQGFYFQKALPAAEYNTWREAWSAR